MEIVRGWHGDGVNDPEIKHDNEPLQFFVLFCFSLRHPLLSNSLGFRCVKKQSNSVNALRTCIDVSRRSGSSSFTAFFSSTLTAEQVHGV